MGINYLLLSRPFTARRSTAMTYVVGRNQLDQAVLGQIDERIRLHTFGGILADERDAAIHERGGAFRTYILQRNTHFDFNNAIQMHAICNTRSSITK